MKMKTSSLKRIALTALFSGIIAVGVVGISEFAASSSASRTLPQSQSGTPVRANDSSSTSTTTTTTPSAYSYISAGPSRSECVAPYFTGSGLGALQSAITNFDNVTNTTVTCVSTYLNGAPTWNAWEHPWVTDPKIGYTSWVAEEPQTRQLVLQVDLIPDSLENVNNPSKWERACADGAYTAHATQLGESLVVAGLQNSVIRLGAEMNGTWEADYVGTTVTDQRLWAKCFAKEVSGIRAAPGGHFLIDWNPNACKYPIPLANFYPGNPYVDIVGLDLFDVACAAPSTPYTFSELAREPAGLASFESFASAHRKPMSLPEWALSTVPSGDDPGYINGIGSTFAKGDFAFETYFDGGGGKSKALPLGSGTPLSLPAFQKWFGRSQG